MAASPVPTGAPVLATGVLFDVLELPAEAGFAVLRRLRLRSPVALGPGGPGRAAMRLLVAPGSAEELPGLLEWLEWGALTTELRAYGAGGSIEAPRHIPTGVADAGQGASGAVRAGWVWLYPPRAGTGAASALPALPAFGDLSGTGGRGGGGGAPGLARLVDAAATECHRLRLWGTVARPAQRCASSYA